MARPHIDLIFEDTSDLVHADMPHIYAVRKDIYHAFYYHNQGWISYPDEVLDKLKIALTCCNIRIDLIRCAPHLQRSPLTLREFQELHRV